MSQPLIVPADSEDAFDFGGFGVVWKLFGVQTGGGFSIVHHPMAPHALAAPLHRHHREDEFSYVIEGRMGALLGDDVVTAEAGDWVAKPRNQWHTFWNADDTPCTIIEVIAPAGFEHYFCEVADHWGDIDAFAAINSKYELDMDFDSVPGLCDRFGLTFGGG